RILPLTTKGIAKGGGVYGAGIFDKKAVSENKDSLLAIGTNMWNKSPLIHGETDCIREFFELPEESRPRTKDTYFFTSHEPCPMCLSAITWGGFDIFYIFWSYEDSETLFDEPYSRRINEAVWGAQDGNYAHENRFWKAKYVVKMVEALEEGEVKSALQAQVARIKDTYAELWKKYK
ncbi:cytidine deaminase-like protein, partial [Leucosporidium creatinivorum]